MPVVVIQKDVLAWADLLVPEQYVKVTWVPLAKTKGERTVKIIKVLV